MLKSMPPRRSRCNIICYIKKQLMSQITVGSGRKYVKDGDKETHRPLKFNSSFILVLKVFMNRIVCFVTCRPTETCKRVKK
jgi:hypothetical protein